MNLFLKLIYFFWLILDKFFFYIFRKNFLIRLNEYIQNKSYKVIEINKKKINFFVPNNLILWRVDTFYKKEPETLEWINSFQNNPGYSFWDIGANIGLYSIYNATRNDKLKTIAFEPSSSNLRVLSRNISINNLSESIHIFPLALSNLPKNISLMNESNFIEGGALNSFDVSYDFDGKLFKTDNKYSTLGTNINFLIKNKILDIPDYIKIDVDGIEHLILQGSLDFLSNKKIKKLMIELNEEFKEQYNNSFKILNSHDFVFVEKKRNENFYKSKNDSKFSNVFNYFFTKKI